MNSRSVKHLFDHIYTYKSTRLELMRGIIVIETVLFVHPRRKLARSVSQPEGSRLKFHGTSLHIFLIASYIKRNRDTMSWSVFCLLRF